MSYCPRCGGKVEETMAFCPTCGNPLKMQTVPTPSKTMPNASENSKIEQTPTKNLEPKEKIDRNFVGYLIVGLILIVFGLFSALSISGFFAGGQGWTIMLVLIGTIIIAGAVYTVLPALRHHPHALNEHQKNNPVKSS